LRIRGELPLRVTDPLSSTVRPRREGTDRFIGSGWAGSLALGMRYRRVVIKLTGAAPSRFWPIGLDAAAVEHVADEFLAVAERGVKVAVVVGGGNFFRGSLADRWGLSGRRRTSSASWARS
jgi:hypothetical protein